MRDLYHLARKNSVYVVVGKAVTPVVNLVVTVYIIRRLSVGDFGTLNVLFAIMGFVGLVSSFGISSVFSRYIPEFYERNETGNIRRLVLGGLLLRLGLIIAVIALLLSFSAFFSSLFKLAAGQEQILRLFALLMVFYLESRTMSVVLESMFLHKQLVISDIAYTVIRAALMFLLVSLYAGLVGIVYAEILSAVLWLLFYIFVYARFSEKRGGIVASPFPRKRIGRYAAFSFLSQTGAEVLGTGSDFLVIAAFTNPLAVGLYAFANKVVSMISNIMPDRLLEGVIAPLVITRHTRAKDVDVLAGSFTFLTKIMAFVYFPAMLGLIILGDKVITFVFSAKYLPSLPVLWVVAGFALLSFFQVPLVATLQALEKAEFSFYSKVFAVYNLVLALVLIKPFGIMGMAFATGSAVLFQNLYLYRAMRRFAPLRFDWRAISKFAQNSLVMGLAVVLLRPAITGLASFALVVAAGVLVYLLSAYLNKGFAEDERRVLNRLLTRPIFVF
jgi:O-antigen/teichoic acid export membrane protein